MTKRLLDAAIAILSELNCQYKIQTPSGHFFESPVSKRVPSYTWEHVDFEPLRGLQVGEEFLFQYEADFEMPRIQSLRSAIVRNASHILGRHNFDIQHRRNENLIAIMRIM